MPEATRRWDGERRLGMGYACERPLLATGDGPAVHGTERGQVGRSFELARRPQATLETPGAAAAGELQALTPAPGRGKRQLRDEAAWQAALARGGARHHVTGRVTVTWARPETPATRDGGRGRGGPDRPTGPAVAGRSGMNGGPRHETALAARRPRLAWRLQVRNAPADHLSLPQAVVHDRGGWALARDVQLMTDRPLGRRPWFVWTADQIPGMARLLTLGLRLLPRRATPVRRGLAHTQKTVAGLYEGPPTPTTDRPTGQRILRAFARAQIPVTPATVGAVTCWHLTSRAPRHEPRLRPLHWPASLYPALAYHSS